MDVRMLSESEIRMLAGMMARAVQNGHEIRVSWQNGLLVKVGGGMWSAPMGK